MKKFTLDEPFAGEKILPEKEIMDRARQEAINEILVAQEAGQKGKEIEALWEKYFSNLPEKVRIKMAIQKAATRQLVKEAFWSAVEDTILNRLDPIQKIREIDQETIETVSRMIDHAQPVEVKQGNGGTFFEAKFDAIQKKKSQDKK